MKNFLVAFLLLVSLDVFSQDGPYDFVRKYYSKANSDSAVCANMIKRLNKASSSDPLMSGYKGAVTAIMAGHVKNQAEKLKLFKEGRSLLEQCIIRDNSNVELHFLRLTVQSNCPKALNYNKDIQDDKAFILKSYSSIGNIELKNMIRDFCRQSTVFTAEEKKQLK